MKKEILIVDDTVENLKLLAEILRNNGYKPRPMPNGKLALQSAENYPPDLILLDISMPEMDGYEVCERIKENPVLKNTPVIFLSAHTETIDKVKAFEAGGVDYISKPYSVEEILSRIDTHLTISSLRKELESHNRDLNQLVSQKVYELSLSQMATIKAMTKLAEARDDSTGVHIERIQSFVKAIIEKLHAQGKYKDQIDDSFIFDIIHASPLHDIGKIAIPDSILLKRGKLTTDEFEIMKTHSQIGADNLKYAYSLYPNNSFISMGIDVALHHHEKWDGSGYPEGLAGENIPLSARVMAIADVYDALRSKRVYKEAMSHKEALEIIWENRGKHFDPLIVDAFFSLSDEIENISSKLF